MILAAGLGTRLRPITDRLPKVLVPVGGVPILERTIAYLVEGGADHIVINTHHHADQIERFIGDRDFGAPISLSHEPDEPLGTGGGILHARPKFRTEAPFVVMIGDVVTDIDLEALISAHHGSDALATLAVHDRETARKFLFDEGGLYGRSDAREGGRTDLGREPAGETVEYAFAGIHVMSPQIFDLMTERGAFDIVPVYLRLCGDHTIAPHVVGDAMWLNIGDPARLEETRRALSQR